jgi:phosphoglycerate-specific signal transduction histidine kinase
MRPSRSLAAVLFFVSHLHAQQAVAADDKSTRFEEVVRIGVQRVLTRILEADTSVDRVSWNKESKVLEIEGLRIANPQGFSKNDAITVKKLIVEAEPDSLTSEEPSIELIKTSGATVNAEVGPDGVNIKRLTDNLRETRERALKRPRLFRGGDESGEKKKLRIERGVLEACQVNVVTPLGNSSKKLDDIDMDFLGEDGKGMTPREAMGKVMQRLVQEIGL